MLISQSSDYSKMEAIPLHRTTVVRSYTNFLTEIGAPVVKGLQQNKLPVLALDDINAYVPSQNVWAFVDHMARNEGIPDLGFRVGWRFDVNCIAPDYSRTLSQSPTLYHGLQTTCRLAAKTVSRSRLWLLPSSRDGCYKFIHKASFNASHPHFGQIDWFAIASMIAIVRQFTGRDWLPKEIGRALPDTADRSIREQLSGSRLLYSQGMSFITIDGSLLSLPPVTRGKELANTSHVPELNSADGVANDFIGSLKQALRAYALDGKPSIELAADLCSITVRSLQRRLVKSGLTYSELIDQVYFEMASTMMEDRDTKVVDIAHALCFDDASHFSRSFRRVAGLSPREYRKRII